jgi:predicted hydrocarbon binding protein
MKGIVFNVLEEVVTDEFGLATWDRLLQDSSASGVYTSLASYDDDEMGRIVQAAAHALGKTDADILRWYGERFIPKMYQRYPEFFTTFGDTRTFLGALNRIIHPEVRKLYPGADVPTFSFETLPDGRFGLGYHSPRKMCAFAEGLVLGAAAHYGETVTIHQPECMHRGDARCLIACHFSPADG